MRDRGVDDALREATPRQLAEALLAASPELRQAAALPTDALMFPTKRARQDRAADSRVAKTMALGRAFLRVLDENHIKERE